MTRWSERRLVIYVYNVQNEHQCIIKFKTYGVAKCVEPDKTHATGLFGRFTHLQNNAWVYYIFSRKSAAKFSRVFIKRKEAH